VVQDALINRIIIKPVRKKPFLMYYPLSIQFHYYKTTEIFPFFPLPPITPHPDSLFHPRQIEQGGWADEGISKHGSNKTGHK